MPTGVYFGWATVEGDEPGCGRAHKAVVNIGMSPTFEEQNPEKVVAVTTQLALYELPVSTHPPFTTHHRLLRPTSLVTVALKLTFMAR